jgi:hypothetical protein
MSYKQSNNPLSRKTSPLRRSPLKIYDPVEFNENSISDDEHHSLSSNNDEHSVMILAPGEKNKSTTYDPKFDAATNTKEDSAKVMKQEGDPDDIVKNVTNSILGDLESVKGIKADGLDQLRPTATVKPNVDMDSKLVNKALSSIDASKNKDLNVDDRNIAERRARRQIARAQRKEIRKTQPKGKERREAIKKTRENQGRKEENMVSE